MQGHSIFTHENLNFQIPPQSRQCFYEDIKLDAPIRSVELFVHSNGDFQVQLAIYGPLDYKSLVHEQFEDAIHTENVTGAKEKESDSQTFTFDFTAQDAGSYAFCVDNRAAHFFPKTVEIAVTNPVSNKAMITDAINKGDTSKAIILNELQDSMKALSKIHKGIINLQLQQQRDRHRLNLHSAMNEKNYNDVYYGSIFETCVFILVSLFQVFFIRRWFASKMPKRAAK